MPEMTTNENHDLSVNGAQFQQTLNRLIGEGKITAEESDLLLYCFKYGKDNHLNNAELGRKMSMDGAMLSGMLKGNYGASYKGIVDKCAAFKKSEDIRIREGGHGFIRTWTYDQIESVCDSALWDKMPAWIFGASQSGKTTSLLEYVRRNPGNTIYLRMGSGWSRGRFVRELAGACKNGNNDDHSIYSLEAKIFDSLSSRQCLIIDEFHQVLVTCTERNQVAIMEYIREVYDRTGCGLVLCGTPVGRDLVFSGPHKKLFDQIRRRGLIELAVPDVPKLQDVNAVARSFNLTAPHGDVLQLIKTILKQSGLGKYIKYLRKASAMAVDDKETLTWDHFVAVNAGYAQMAIPDNEY